MFSEQGRVIYHRRKRKSRFTKLMLVLFGFIFVLAVYWLFLKRQPESLPLSSSVGSSEQNLGGVSVLSLSTNRPENLDSALSQVVQKSLEGTRGTYAVAIKNLKNGETYLYNEHRVFEAGSLYKLWVMNTVMEKINQGVLKEDDVLEEDVQILNSEFSIDPELAEQTEGTVSFTVNDALKQMITISHNYAALILTAKIRLSTVAKFLADNNFKESQVGTNGEAPVTTALDIMRYLEKLYLGQLSDKESTDKMLNLLKMQQLNDKIPKYLPVDTMVAHKTGEIGQFSHDVGIVYSSKGDYIIVILSESDYPPGAEERIAQVSQAVYQYFNSK